jgi:hypothetical protein
MESLGPEKTHETLSSVLRDIMDGPEAEVSIGQMMMRFGHRSFGAVLFLFSAPNLLPMPPGASTFFAIPLLLVGPQVLIGVRAMWLPRGVRDRKIQQSTLVRLLSPIISRLERIERFSRPRISILFGSVGDRLIGLVITILAIVLVLPIPLGNMLPAAAIAAFALALLSRDGVLGLAGYGLTAVSTLVLVLMGSVVMEALRQTLRFVHACPPFLCGAA